MGLAKAVAARFPDWGPEFVTLIVRPCQGLGLLACWERLACCITASHSGSKFLTSLYMLVWAPNASLRLSAHHDSIGRWSSAAALQPACPARR